MEEESIEENTTADKGIQEQKAKASNFSVMQSAAAAQMSQFPQQP